MVLWYIDTSLEWSTYLLYMRIGNCHKGTSSLFGSCLFVVSVLWQKGNPVTVKKTTLENIFCCCYCCSKFKISHIMIQSGTIRQTQRTALETQLLKRSLGGWRVRIFHLFLTRLLLQVKCFTISLENLTIKKGHWRFTRWVAWKKNPSTAISVENHFPKYKT